MQKVIPWELIQPGFRLPGAICDQNGRVLIEGGVELSEADVRALDSLPNDEVFGDDDWMDKLDAVADQLDLEGRSGFVEDDHGIDSYALMMGGQEEDDDSIQVDALRIGMRLSQDVYDDSDVLLLAGGMEITSRFLDLLRQRNIKVVRLKSVPPESVDVEKEHTSFENRKGQVCSDLEDLLPNILQQAPSFYPVRAWRRPRVTLEALRKEALHGIRRHAAASEAISQIGSSLQVGGNTSIRSLHDIMSKFVSMVSLDFDLLPLVVSLQRTRDEYLFDHCVNVAMISMSIAAQLGYTQDQIMEVGLGGLLQDIGMLRIPGQIRLAPRKFTPRERAQVDKHPIYTLEMLDGIRGLPDVIKLIGYQSHERADGSGYPNQALGEKLHTYSMIVAIADTYAAMTRPRPHRPAAMPYEAARTILISGSAQKFDIQIVRAFLDVMSLFPIGSVVQLSDGKRGRVVRANPDFHTKPVLEILDHDDLSTHIILDLSKENDLKIVSAFPPTRIMEP